MRTNVDFFSRQIDLLIFKGNIKDIQKDFVESDKVYIRNMLDCLNIAGIFIKRDQKCSLSGNTETATHRQCGTHKKA